VTIELPDVTNLLVAVDTETSGLHFDPPARGRVSVVSLAYNLESELAVRAWPFDQGFAPHGDRKPEAPIQDELDLFGDTDPNLGEQEWRELMHWLAQQRLVFHNAKFDLHMLREGTRHWRGAELVDQTVWDTMVGQSLLNPRHSQALKATAERIWGDVPDEQAELKKSLRKRKLGKRYDLLPWHEIAAYAAKDAELTLRLAERQLDSFECGESSWAWMAAEMALLKTLYRMERRGVAYDADASRALADELRLRAAEAEGSLPFRATNAGAKRFFFEEQGVMPYKTTARGAASLDAEVLTKMVGDGIPWAKEYYDLTSIDNAISMWYEGWADATGDDGRLRTTYRQTRVKSGRMSVERVQLHAVPKEDKTIEGVASVRSLFHPRPGYQLWNLDLGQAELRVATHLAKCKTMAEELEEGVDFHSRNAIDVLGADPEAPDFKVWRDVGKRTTFSGLFGAGGDRLAATARMYGIEIPRARAQEIVLGWRRKYPEFQRASRRYERIAQYNGVITLVNGRQSWFGPNDQYYSAWNRMVQGSLAELNKLWLVEADKWAGPQGLLLSVHDSIVLELPEESGDRIAHTIAGLSAKLATDFFGTPMTVDVGRFGRVDNA
jgi:DNA polymerase-1